MIKKFICLILLLVCISCTSTDRDTNTRSDEIILDDPENPGKFKWYETVLSKTKKRSTGKRSTKKI